MKLGDKYLNKCSGLLKLIYTCIFIYIFVVLAFVSNSYDIPIPLGTIYWMSWYGLTEWFPFSFIFFVFFRISFLSLAVALFLKPSKMKVISNIIFQILLFFDIVVYFIRASRIHFNEQVWSYSIWCMILDCGFIMLISFSVWLDMKKQNKTKND